MLQYPGSNPQRQGTVRPGLVTRAAADTYLSLWQELEQPCVELDREGSYGRLIPGILLLYCFLQHESMRVSAVYKSAKESILTERYRC
jgi:hypothetical protein